MGNTALPALSEAEQIFFDLIWAPALTALEGSTLNIPFAGPILGIIFNAISIYIYGKFVLFIDVETISLVNEEHQKAYDAASLYLASFKIGTSEYEKARDAAKAALSKFTDIDPAS